MTQDSEQFESLKSKLQKLQALAERGCQGEANNARRAIERICQQYGVKLEEVLDIETKHAYTFEIGRNKEMMNLFIRCLCSVCDISGMTYTQPTRSAIRIELTAMQYADISSLFNWHKANYKREFDDFKRSFMSAYIGKHNLYFDDERSGSRNREDLTPEDMERIWKAWKIQEAMSNNTYRKQLEANNHGV